ncbi:MAG: diguanylate cyclase [Planctomycetales bacterium]|nr:diguanylate cyclase [Planctomycetales bacterium]
MGAFDDLIPQQSAGLFDDLVPNFGSKVKAGAGIEVGGIGAEAGPSLAERNQAWEEGRSFPARVGYNVERGIRSAASGLAGTNTTLAMQELQDINATGEAYVGVGRDRYRTKDPAQVEARRAELQRVIDSNVADLGYQQAQIQEIPQRPATEALGQAESVGGALRTIANDPLGIIGDVTTQSMTQMAPALVAAAVTRNPYVGAGLMGLSSAQMEYGASLADVLSQRNINVSNPEAVKAALKANPSLAQEAHERGLTRGAIIGSVDAISGGLAGTKIFANKAGNLLAQTGVQASLGGTGEALGQLATDGELHAGEIAMEVLGEAGSAPAEVYAMGRDSIRDEALLRGLDDSSYIKPRTGLMGDAAFYDRPASDPTSIQSAIDDFNAFKASQKTQAEVDIESGENIAEQIINQANADVSAVTPQSVIPDAITPQTASVDAEIDALLASDLDATPESERALDDAIRQGEQDGQIPSVQPDEVDGLPQDVFSRSQNAKSGWIIRDKETGESVLETWDKKKVDALNTDRYEAVPAGQHLAELNNPDTLAYEAARGELNERIPGSQTEPLEQTPAESRVGSQPGNLVPEQSAQSRSTAVAGSELAQAPVQAQGVPVDAEGQVGNIARNDQDAQSAADPGQLRPEPEPLGSEGPDGRDGGGVDRAGGADGIGLRAGVSAPNAEPVPQLDYRPRLAELRRLGEQRNPEQQTEYVKLLEEDRVTAKVGGEPIQGVRNFTEYRDMEADGELPAYTLISDADSFKLINDEFGHDLGDQVIRVIGTTMRDEGIKVQAKSFHRSGDEFLAVSNDADQLAQLGREVNKVLATKKIRITRPDGSVVEKTGVQLSFGVGRNEAEADGQLKQDKDARAAAGLRTERRDSPRVADRVDAAGVVADSEGSVGQGKSGSAGRLSSDAQLSWVDDLIGWDEKGGIGIREFGGWEREGEEAQGQVVDRTKWVDVDGFWKNKPDPISEAQARKILKKYRGGYRLGAREQRFIDYAKREAAARDQDAEIAEREFAQETRDRSELDRQELLEDLRQEGFDARPSEEEEALLIADWISRAYDAGVSEDDILSTQFMGAGYQAPELAKLIEEAKNGNEPRETEATDRSGTQSGEEARGEGSEAEVDPLLESYSEADLARRSDKDAAREAADTKERKQAEQDRLKKAERDFVRQNNDAAAAEFQLGQSAEDNITGQKGLFSSPDTHRRRTERAAKSTFRLAKNAPTINVELAPPDGVVADGSFDPETNTVTLYSDYIDSPQRARWVAAHEVTGHYGMRGVLGDALDPELKRARSHPIINSVANAIAKERAEGDVNIATEEALAELSAADETGDFDGIESRYGVKVPTAMRSGLRAAIARFIAAIKNLATLNLQQFSDSDWRKLVNGARRYVRTGDGR